MKNDIKTLSQEDLSKKLSEIRESLRKNRFDAAGAQLVNSAQHKMLRKELARVETELTSRLSVTHE